MIAAPRFSAREAEVLRLLVLGYSDLYIGEQLGLATKAIQATTGRIYEKLGFRDNPDYNRRGAVIAWHYLKP